MTIFDLLFLFLALLTLITLFTAAVQALRGQRGKALAILKRFLVCFAVYMALVCIVALAKPQRVFALGEKHCFDDWCVAVTKAQRDGARYDVTLEIFSEAKRVTQRANNAIVYMIDGQGHRFDPQPDPSAIPLDVLLGPGQKVETNRTFQLSGASGDLGLVVWHGGSYCFPSCFIIGDNANPLAKHTIVKLP
jgi:hypothetical protein